MSGQTNKRTNEWMEEEPENKMPSLTDVVCGYKILFNLVKVCSCCCKMGSGGSLIPDKCVVNYEQYHAVVTMILVKLKNKL